MLGLGLLFCFVPVILFGGLLSLFFRPFWGWRRHRHWGYRPYGWRRHGWHRRGW